MDSDTAFKRLDSLFHAQPDKLGRFAARLEKVTSAQYRRWDKLASTEAEVSFVETIMSDMGTAAAAGPAVPRSTAAPAATSTELFYKDIVLYTPMDHEEYFKMKFPQTSRKQLASKLEVYGYQIVVPVDKEPSQLLQLRGCKDRARDIDVVELRDGMQLAVPVAEGLLPVDKLYESVMQGEDSSGCQQSSQWAKDRLSGDKGARRFCFKRLRAFVQSLALHIEIDGMAYSAQRVVLVERKPSINYQVVEELGMKERTLRKLVEARAPNTDVLLDPATGQIKPVETFLMADGWVEDPEQQAACTVRMLELNITPVLPRGGAHDVGDSCHHTWPPQRTQQLLAEAQRFHSNKNKRLPPTGSSAGSAADGGGTTGDGGTGPVVRAAHTGRHGGSASRIVSSPALSGGCTRLCHVSVGQHHYRVTPCRPARLLPHLSAVTRAAVRGL